MFRNEYCVIIMTNTKENSKMGLCLIVTAAACWGFSSVVLLPRLCNLSTDFVVLMQNLVPLAIMSCFMFGEYANVLKLPKRDFFLLSIIALFSGVIGILAIVKALFLVNFHQLSLVVLVQKIQPVFTVVLASIFLKERVSVKFVLWSIVALAGIYLITFGFNLPIVDKGGVFLLACSLSILSALSFSINTIVSKHLTLNIQFSTMIFGRFLIGTIFSIIICIFSGTIWSFKDVTTNNWIILIVSFITLGPVSMYIYYYGLKKVKAMVSALGELALPFSVIILDYLINGTHFTLVQWIGSAMIIFGILKISTGRIQKETKVT